MKTEAETGSWVRTVGVGGGDGCGRVGGGGVSVKGLESDGVELIGVLLAGLNTTSHLASCCTARLKLRPTPPQR